MKPVILGGGAVVLAVAAYFGAQALGLIGGDSPAMSDEAISAALATQAEAANAADGMRYDDFSRLTAAVVDGKTITFEGVSLLNADQLDESYLDSRTAQAGNLICNDPAMRALSEAGATMVYNWTAADGAVIGTVTAGPAFCGEQGY